VDARPQNQQVIPPAQPPQTAGAPVKTDQFSMPDQRDIQTGVETPVAPPRDRRNAADREPEYLQNLEAQRAAFGNIAMLADKNRQKITQIEGQFADFREMTDDELEDLDQRVTYLEGLLKSGGKLTENANSSDKQSKAKASTKPERANEEMTNSEKTERTSSSSSDDTSKFVYKVPKTPAEIKELQQTLKDYGYRPGKVDGVLGEQTRWAIKRLQEEHGLPVTGWLSAETMMAIQNPKHYSGTYPTETKRRIAKPTPKKKPASEPDPLRWYVRGVTPTKAVVYRQDGMSYAVSVGSEIPGMGQVTRLDTDKLQVVTAKGVISRR
jgi:peptidoglycan hydrolase-like protein with peptidoglycan-binding domain